MDLKLDVRSALRSLCWLADGKTFYFLDGKGTLRKIGLLDLTEELRLDTGLKCGWVSVSAEGVVLTVTERQEVWLLDPATFKVKSRIQVGALAQAVSAPGLSFAYATTTRGDSLVVLDLKKGEAVHEHTGGEFARGVGFGKAIVSPDGKYLFTVGGAEQLYRFAIAGNRVKYEEESLRIVQGRHEGIDVSADSSMVAVPSGGGNYKIAGVEGVGPYCTYLFEVGNIRKPKLVIKQGPYPLTIAFDRKADLIYAHQGGHQLILFNSKGIRLKELQLGAGSTRQILAHPEGKKMLVLTDQKLFCVELPKQ